MSTELSQQKREILTNMCKVNGIKNYSKLKKDDLIAVLNKAGITEVSGTITPPQELVKKEIIKKVSTPAKPRVDNLSKKLEKAISVDDFKTDLAEFTEEVTDLDIYNLLSDVISKFIKNDAITDIDYKKYVDSYGVMAAVVNYTSNNTKVNLSKFTEQELYKNIAIFIYNKDTSVYELLIKKFRKYIDNLHKAAKLAAAEPVAKVIKVKTVKVTASKKEEKEEKEEEEEEEEEDEEDEEEDDEHNEEEEDEE